nr:MAG TPA: hypothetical protein [Caudoviricetes sp.]
MQSFRPFVNNVAVFPFKTVEIYLTHIYITSYTYIYRKSCKKN